MLLVSWNVNGLRACMNKGFEDFFKDINSDIFCIQETKMQRDQLEIDFPGYYQYWNDAVKKGYSGTAVFTKTKPLSERYGLGLEKHDAEGRVITLEYDSFYLVCCYTPNSQRELLRLPYRMEWEEAFRDFLLALDKEKPVILCGDLNVAHEEIDIKNHKSNHKNAGFTDDEREKMTKLLNSGFVDTFRYLNPGRENAYTWWSYMGNAREKNVGWRIDYFIASGTLKDKISNAFIYPEIFGSDHCPVGLEMKL